MGQRQLAARALESVQKLATEKENAKYKTLCMKMPSLLAQSGLAQTVTFLRARERKKNMSGERYLEEVIKVLGREGIRNVEALQTQALTASLPTYMELTQALQTAMIWMRRFAQVEMAHLEEAEAEE